jgi:hypothetical protein
MQSGPAAYVVGGWQLSSVFTAYTGQPFTPLASGTSLNAPGSTQRADCISTPQNIGSILQWYSKSSFAVPKTGMINVDVGLDRNFKISERFELKFRAESFNMANTPHHANPNSTQANVSNSSFMQATDIRNTGRDGLDERTFRVGLKLTW